jgi:hypothetical protein
LTLLLAISYKFMLKIMDCFRNLAVHGVHITEMAGQNRQLYAAY